MHFHKVSQGHCLLTAPLSLFCCKTDRSHPNASSRLTAAVLPQMKVVNTRIISACLSSCRMQLLHPFLNIWNLSTQNSVCSEKTWSYAVLNVLWMNLMLSMMQKCKWCYH